MKNYMCADIGSCNVKLGTSGDGRAVSSQTPNKLVIAGNIVSFDAMTQHITSMMKESRVSAKEATVVLSPGKVYVRTLTLPAMSDEEMVLNLPYEFREYVVNDEKDYIYDYAVMETKLSDKGTPIELTVLAAAVAKNTMKEYMEMFKKAGSKLVVAAPEEMGYCNLIRAYIKANPEQKDDAFCIVDLGHSATRVHVLKGQAYTLGRSVEVGGQDIDMAIAKALEIDQFLARDYKEQNQSDCQNLPEVKEVYDRIAIEVMRAVNFFGYSNAGSEIKNIYICGGGANIEGLVRSIALHNTDATIRNIRDIYPRELSNAERELTPAALGVAMM